MEHTMIVQREPEPLALARIGERFRHLRIVDPAAERAITTSMHRFGQLTPVVVCRLEPGQFQLLDGFKRLSAARSLAMQELSACRLEASLRAGKAAMLHLNRAGRMISGMEEALVVHSLCHEDGLSQVEIAELLGRHKSWVSRRVALIARLSDEAQEQIRLGLLSPSLGVELTKLQRCNQHEVLAAIGKHHLTWRETRKLVAKIIENPRSCGQFLLDPRRALAPEPVEIDPVMEVGLGLEAKVMFRKLLRFERHCLGMALALETSQWAQFASSSIGAVLGANSATRKKNDFFQQKFCRIRICDKISLPTHRADWPDDTTDPVGDHPLAARSEDESARVEQGRNRSPA